MGGDLPDVIGTLGDIGTAVISADVDFRLGPIDGVIGPAVIGPDVDRRLGPIPERTGVGGSAS